MANIFSLLYLNNLSMVNKFLLLSTCMLVLSCEENSNDGVPQDNSEISSAEFFVGEVTTAPIPDVFTNGESNFYGFNLASTCLATLFVENAPVEFRINIFEERSNNTRIIRTSYIDPGENYKLIVGPYSPGIYYIELEPRSSEEATSEYNVRAIFDCTDTDEPNNTFSEATVAATDGTPYYGRILAVNDGKNYEDFDMFKFSNSEYGIAKIRLTAPVDIRPTNQDIEFVLYNEANDATKLEERRVSAGETDEILVGPLPPGDHYISINYKGECNCQGEETYSLRVNFDTRDIHEPNDAIVNATPMTLNTEYRGMLAHPNWKGTKDEDWFKYTPTSSGMYKITLVGTPAYPFSSSIPQTALQYSDVPNSNNLDYLTGVNGQEISEVVLELSSGTEYYFLVYRYWAGRESDGMYSLKIEKQ